MKDNSYSGILKGMSIFGGVQALQILINLVRGKFVAVLLGPDGMGISSIFSTSATTLTRASSLGLNLAIVREAAGRRGDADGMRTLLGVVEKLVRITALGGCLLCVLLSGVLSRLSFGSSDYAWQFMLLSAAVYLSVSGSGKLSMLQGAHEMRRVAGASLVGAVAGLCAGVPLYFFFGDKGIVPAIVALSLSTWLFYSYSLRKGLGLHPAAVRLREHRPLVRRLLLTGIVLLAGDIIASACNYGVNIFLRYSGGVETVGFYQAANSVTGQYAGMVFTAMSLDYFPRLAANIDERSRMSGIVSRQIEVVAMVMAPIACCVILTAPVIIRVLLSDSFLEIVPLMRWMGLGVVFKALHYPMGYIAFAKNNRRLFFWMEAVGENLLFVGGIIVFYYFFGLIGLGYAFVFDNVMTLLVYATVNYKAYGYVVGREAVSKGSVCILLALACFLSSLINDAILSYLLMASITALSAGYCIRSLRKKTAAE